MGGSETPYGSPMPTPINNGYQGGSMAGSPYMSPMTGMEQQQSQASAGALVAVPASPGMQPFQSGTPVAQQTTAVPPQGVPNLPPWPFGAPGSMQGASTPQGPCGAGAATPQASAGSMDSGMPYFCQMGPMVQSMPQQQQQPMGNMMNGMAVGCVDGGMQH